MKNIIIILLLAGIVSCAGNSLISEIESEIGQKREPVKTGDGRLMYEYSIGNDFLLVEKKASGIIDRRLGVIGRQTTRGGTINGVEFFNAWHWETPEQEVEMNVIYGQPGNRVKIWIYDK